MTSLVVDAGNIHFLRANTDGVFKAPLADGAAGPPAATSGAKLVGQDATCLYPLQSGCRQSALLKVIKEPSPGAAFRRPDPPSRGGDNRRFRLRAQ